MSTRAMYTFIDAFETHHVYGQSDGYPSGASLKIKAAIPFAWAAPRFEADEFAAAFVSGNKDSPGGIRLCISGPWKKVAPFDLAYRYEIDGRARHGLDPLVTCWAISERAGKRLVKKQWSGPLSTIDALAEVKVK